MTITSVQTLKLIAQSPVQSYPITSFLLDGHQLYLSGYNGMQLFDTNTRKCHLSSDCSLQLDYMKLESLVIADQNTAKTYVDAVAQTAVKTTTIIPVESMQILSEGTSSGVSFKQHLYRNTIFIAGAAGVVCIFIEIIVCLILCAFKKKEDRSDDEYEYEARYGRYVYPRHELIDADAKRLPHENARKASYQTHQDMV